MRSKATDKTEGYKSRLWASLKQLCPNFVVARFLVSNKKQALCLKYFYIRVTWTVYPEGLSWLAPRVLQKVRYRLERNEFHFCGPGKARH